jgi:hypothetical protein
MAKEREMALEAFAKAVSTYKSDFGGVFCFCGNTVKTCQGGDCLGFRARKALAIKDVPNA